MNKTVTVNKFTTEDELNEYIEELKRRKANGEISSIFIAGYTNSTDEAAKADIENTEDNVSDKCPDDCDECPDEESCDFSCYDEYADFIGTLMGELDDANRKLDKLEKLIMLQPVFFPSKKDGATRKDLKKWVRDSVENVIKGELTGVLLNDETLKSLASNEDIQILFEVMRDELARKEDIDALNAFMVIIGKAQNEKFSELSSKVDKINESILALSNKVAAMESFLDMRITETAAKPKAKPCKKS